MVGSPKRLVKQLKRWLAYRQIERLGLIDCLQDYPQNAIRPKYDHMYGLYRLVCQRKPEIVLELGGGFSTFALAKACHDLRAVGCSARLYSVDQSPYWQGVVQQHMPSDLRSYVTFHRADVTQEHGITSFASLPVDRANLVFIDGGGRADSLRLEEKAPNDFAILVDSRKGVVEFLRSNLRGRYTVTPWVGFQTLFLLRG
jgi:hypothetical protein